MGVTRQIFVDYLALRVTWGDANANFVGDGIVFVMTRQEIQTGSDTRSTSTNNSTDCNSWSNPGNVVSNNGKYASCGPSLGAYSNLYSAYGFSVPANAKILKVEILLDWFANTNPDSVEVDIMTPGTPDTCGNAVSYSPPVGYNFPYRGSEGQDIADVTSQRNWQPADFDNANLRVMMIGFVGIV